MRRADRLFQLVHEELEGLALGARIVAAWGDKWTLAAWCELRRDYRSFRPDRMGRVDLLEQRFDPDGSISLADFLRQMEEGRVHGGGRDPIA
jgi:hypothetical protein